MNFLVNLDKACAKNKARQIFFAEDKRGNVRSAIYIVWDDTSAYLLMSGSNPEFRDKNFKAILVWEAMKFISDSLTIGLILRVV